MRRAVASLIGQRAGELVGYRTRIDHAVSAQTRIEVVTEGLLVRRLLADPLLDGVGCVILDEVHERSLDGDLALAFCLDLQRSLRPELRCWQCRRPQTAPRCPRVCRRRSSRVRAGCIRSRCVMRPVTRPRSATCPTRWRARYADCWQTPRPLRATSSPSCPASARSGAWRPRCPVSRPRSCRCMASCRRPSRTWYCRRPPGTGRAVSYWRPRSPRPR